jgi:hypothetical protein
MTEIFGDFVEHPIDGEYLIIHFSPSSMPLKQRWRNTGLSADFLAEYWATFFPAHDVLSQSKQREIQGAIAYIANELLENLMKFSYEPANYPVRLALYLYDAEFRFYAGNAIDPRAIRPFQTRIRRLLTEDIEALYMQQLEENVANPDSTESNLGLLTMIHDYGASLAWKFETTSQEGAEIIVMTTMARLTI